MIHLHKDIDNRNTTGSSEIIIYIYGQWILDNATKKIMG